MKRLANAATKRLAKEALGFWKRTWGVPSWQSYSVTSLQLVTIIAASKKRNHGILAAAVATLLIDFYSREGVRFWNMGRESLQQQMVAAQAAHIQMAQAQMQEAPNTHQGGTDG